MANRIQCYPDGTLFAEMYALIAETFRRSGHWRDLGLRLTRLFLDAGLPWPTIRDFVFTHKDVHQSSVSRD